MVFLNSVDRSPTELFHFAEFQKIAMATAIGFAIMGFIGFFVKLIHIPINNIIVYVYAISAWKLLLIVSFSSYSGT